MNRTLLNIKARYEEMGKAEKKIADWLLGHPEEIVPLSITELAEQSQSSEATIVRFSKRLGFSGYQELKLSLAQESNKKIISDSITPEDSCFDVFEKMCNDIYLSLEKTKKSLDPLQLQKAAEMIMAVGSTLLFGLGNSASVALDASHKLLRAGCPAYAYSDNHMQAIAASHVKPGDVAIGISHSGSSKDLVEALHIARSRGAVTLCITNRGKSPIVKESDVALFTDADETKYSILALNSRLAQLAIVDALYLYIVCHAPAAPEAIRSTEQALMSKKY